MANKNSEPLDIDDLLALTEDEETTIPEADMAKKTTPKAAPAPETPAAEPVETDAQRRIRELEAELAKPSPVPAAAKEPTLEELKIQELEDKLARKRTVEFENAPTEYAASTGGESILLHFVTDGFLACGQTWYTGQELEFEVGSLAHKQQLDRNGNSWLDLIDDVDGQYDRWGKEYFRRGPWRGRKWGDTTTLTDPDEIAAAQKAAQAEAKRNRAAPIIR